MRHPQIISFFIASLSLGAIVFASCGKDTTGAEPWEVGEEFACMPNEPERVCYSGTIETLREGVCQSGRQVCEAGIWSECVGEVLPGEEVCNGLDDDCDGEVDEGVLLACGLCPEEVDGAPEVCSNGVDDDCDGEVDEACVCVSEVETCYDGPPGTRGVGVCEDGQQTCRNGIRSTCQGATLPSPEMCGDGLDNNCDGRIDEDCETCLSTRNFISETRWQMHRGGDPVCWDFTYEEHGSRAAFRMARIPEEEDRGWTPVSEERISFTERSTLCGDGLFSPPMCECRRGGDYTYFQTFLQLGEGKEVENFRIDIGTVDDGARVTIYNDRYPFGYIDPEAYVSLFGSLEVNLARHLALGTNRIVITHVDDCCNQRVLEGVRVLVDGVEIVECEE